MQCGVSSFFEGFFSFFIVIYGFITVLGIVKLFQTQQYRLDKTRAMDDELGVKPGWLVDEQRKINGGTDGIMGGVSLLRRIYRKDAVIIIAILALVVASLVQWDVCFK